MVSEKTTHPVMEAFLWSVRRPYTRLSQVFGLSPVIHNKMSSMPLLSRIYKEA